MNKLDFDISRTDIDSTVNINCDGRYGFSLHLNLVDSEDKVKNKALVATTVFFKGDLTNLPLIESILINELRGGKKWIKTI